MEAFAHTDNASFMCPKKKKKNPWGLMHYTQPLRSPWEPGAGGALSPIDGGDQGGEITLITYSMLSQVQQRREAHKDPGQGGLLLHCGEQEVQEHISEFSFFFFFSPFLSILFVFLVLFLFFYFSFFCFFFNFHPCSS